MIGLCDRLPLSSNPPILQSSKTQAESAVLDAAAIVTVPAAILPLGGLTAARALDIADTRPGDTLPVTGAAGTVGGYTVQLAVRR